MDNDGGNCVNLNVKSRNECCATGNNDTSELELVAEHKTFLFYVYTSMNVLRSDLVVCRSVISAWYLPSCCYLVQYIG